MNDQVANEIVVALTPYIDSDNIQDIKLLITMALSKYEIGLQETHLTVYEGDINEIIIKRFISAKIAAGLSKRTIYFYNKSIRFVLERIGKPYNEITPEDIRVYFAKRLYKEGVTKTYINNERRNLSAFYGWLQKEEILLKNPINKVDPIKVTKVKKKAFEQMEIEKIRNACRTKREKAMIEVLLSTWMRVSEVVSVKLEDLQEDHFIIRGKGDKDREVFLNAKAILAIQNYMAERSDCNPYLFPKAKYAGRSYCYQKMVKGNSRATWPLWYQNPELVDESRHMDHSSFESIIREIGKRAGVPNTHPHRFRRTGATIALRNGMSLITVSKLLGHENIGTTQIYLDVDNRELEEAHRKFVV